MSRQSVDKSAAVLFFSRLYKFSTYSTSPLATSSPSISPLLSRGHVLHVSAMLQYFSPPDGGFTHCFEQVKAAMVYGITESMIAHRNKALPRILIMKRVLNCASTTLSSNLMQRATLVVPSLKTITFANIDFNAWLYSFLSFAISFLNCFLFFINNN